MKNLFTLSVLALSGLVPLNAQIQKDYIAKAKEPNANFFKITKETEANLKRNRSARNATSQSKQEKKAIKQYLRWKYNYLYRINSDGQMPSDLQAYYNVGLLDKNGKISAKSIQTPDPNDIYITRNWTNVGPQTVPNTNTYTNYPQMGRVSDLLYLNNATDPDAHVLFVTTPGGGLWRSTDNGTTWTSLLERYASLGTTDVKAAPDVNITNYTTRPIYVSTGDFDGGHSNSIGVIKSTDGGTTFVSTGLSYTQADQQKTSNLIVIDDNTLLVGDNNGIKRSTDGGTTWTLVHEMTNNVGRLTKSGQNIIASNKRGAIVLSTNNGLTWTEIRAQSPEGPKGEGDRHAFTTNATGQFYAVNRIGQLKRLITTVDPDTNATTYSWENVGVPPTGYDGQDGYNQSLIIDGTRIISGAMNAYHSTDDGATWYESLNGYWKTNATTPGSYIHSDHHAMGKLPVANKYWSCNDGGLSYITYDPTNLQRPSIEYKTNTLVNTQMYTVAINPSNADNNYITGNQDNDAFSKVGNTWYAVEQGDGIQTAVNYNNPNIKYAGDQNCKIIRSTTGFVGQLSGNDSITLPNGEERFYFPLEINKTDPTILYAAHKDVYRINDDATDMTITALNSGFSTADENQIVNLSTHGSILLANDASSIKRYAVVAPATTPSWADINSPVTENLVNLDFDQNNTTTLYATKGAYTAGEKVYKSTDDGVTWNNISGNLPNITMEKILRHQIANTELLFVATELGVYYKTTASASWFKLGANLPNVKVTDIEINYTNKQLIASTFGRGLWNIDLTHAVLGTQSTDEALNKAFSISPVPAHQELNVYLPEGTEYNYQIINTVGGILQSGKINKAHTVLDTSNLVNNAYLIRVFNQKSEISKKFIVKH